MRSRLVGHVDADLHYVSAERVRFPLGLGKPVGVLGNQGACVIAKGYAGNITVSSSTNATDRPVGPAHARLP
jgi:hypothetical protein